jgi:copper chaperone CopZ
MKKLIFILLIGLFSASVQAQFTKASLQASGLTCSMCNNAIYKALKALPFVASVDANVKTATFNIAFKDNVAADIDALKNAVEDAGFSVSSFSVTGKFDHLAIGNDKHIVIGDRHFHFVKVNDQVLNGEKTITIVDKGFLSVKNFKKFSSATSMACMQTGKSGSCCEKEGVAANTRVYHATLATNPG